MATTFPTFEQWAASQGLQPRIDSETGQESWSPFAQSRYQAERFGLPVAGGMSYGLGTGLQNVDSYEDLLRQLGTGEKLGLPAMNLSEDRINQILQGLVSSGTGLSGQRSAFDSRLTPEELDVANQYRNYQSEDDWFTKWGPALGTLAFGGLIGATGGFGGAGLDAYAGAAGAGGAGAGAGAGAFGGDIAGTAAAGEGLGAASGGFSWTDPTSWLSPDAPWGVNPIGGGDLPAGYFDDFVPGTFDGPSGAAVGDIAGIAPSAGVPSGSTLNSILGWAQANPNLAGQLLGSGTNALSSYLSSQAQQDAANQSNQTLWNMYQQNRADLAPWRTAGVGALGQLVDLTTPGKQLDTAMLDPGYAFRQQEGQNALDNAARAAGRFYSGRQLKDTAAYNQNFATGEFGNVYNRLAGLAGTGQAATNQTGAFGQNTAQSVANNQTSAGANRASGYMGVGNAITGGITGYLNNMNQQSIIDKLIASGAFR